jgi:hypothetical protein
MNYPQDITAAVYWMNVFLCRKLLEHYSAGTDFVSQGICDGAREWLRENCCEPDL